MPVTRSEGRGRKPPAVDTQSTEGNRTTTTATGTTATGSTDRSATTTTEASTSTEQSSTATAPSTMPIAGVPFAKPPDVVAKVLAENAAKSHSKKDVPATVTEASQDAETSTVKTVRGISGLPKPSGPPDNRAPSIRKGKAKSTYSKKAQKITKAKEELLRLQVELAAARLAALEAEDSDDDDDDGDDSIQSEVNARVDDWLESQVPRPVLAITDASHYPTREPEGVTRKQNTENIAQLHQPNPTPAGEQRHDFNELATAITLAVKAAQRPKFTELPIFSGSHQEWLPFRAAYIDTENMFSTVENTNRLRRNLKGKAKEAVDGLLITSAHPTEIMKTLESRFGRPESIAMSEMEALRALPRLSESPRDICIFATKISNIIATLKTLNCINYMYNPEISKIVVDKLTPTLRYRFYEFAATQNREDPDLMKIEKFMKREADLCGPYALPEQVTTPNPTTIPHRKQQRVHNVMENTYIPKCPICQETGHNVTGCEQFKNAEENERWDLAKSKRLCFRCLRYRNKNHNCKGYQCGVNNCKYYHHKMLHYTKKADKIEKKENIDAAEIINSAWTNRQRQSYLKILPVQVTGPKGTVRTFALLDDGSTVTLIDDEVTERIGATGPIDPLKIESINELKTSETASKRVNIRLSGLNNHSEEIQARTVNRLRVAPQRVTRKIVNECKHLEDIHEHLLYSEAQPQILIGQDNWHLLLTSEVRKGNRNQPVASLTSLGWVLHGNYARTKHNSLNFVSHLTETAEEELNNAVKHYFEMDNLCIAPKKPKSDPEEQALRILEKVTKRTDLGRYETGLLWRNEDITLPNNYENSLKRLHSIEKKLDRDPELKQRYTQQMEDLITKGYAEPAPSRKTPGRTWYLPHFGVVNPLKPEKLRVVHDAAAKTKGVALNDMLLKGPDLLKSLPGVIMRFRQHEIAVTADIKEMFMQVALRAEDRDALRYLWRGNRRDDQPPEEYRMTALIFGASSSPSTAIYVKNLNAKQHEVAHPEAAAAIINKHYVDDYLDSFRTITEANRITKEVREIHQKAGFILKQWKSNSQELLQELGEDNHRGNIELYKPEERAERVLGVIWKLDTDELGFNLNMTRIPKTLIGEETPTKREALRVVMSLFDPLGFASPVTIKAKQILQEVWRRGTPWDDQIDEDLAEQWTNWTVHLKNLNNVTISRCYLNYSDASTLQLHVFTDASELAYSTVLFWRIVTPNGDVHVSHIMGKAKVAPLKLTSIPRLELQAAIVGARLAETVIAEHERKPDCKVFWTDSKTVLAWIKTGSRSYRPYVAHRLAEIEEITKVNEWRWIPTKLNVADDATRDVPTHFGKEHRWYKGPDFLYEPEELWPIETVTTPTSTPEEERVHYIQNRRQKLAEALPEVSRFSNWERLRYTTARVLQFIQLCRPEKHNVCYKRTMKNKEKDPTWRKNIKKTLNLPKIAKKLPSDNRTYQRVTAELLKAAENLLMRASQEESFGQDIDRLISGKQVEKGSRLGHLSIEYINGSLKIRSRIRASEDVPEELISPMVLDGNHPTIKLWIQAMHRKLHHAGVETIVNECKQQYWILRIRPITRAIVKKCLFCRMRNQAPPYPRTGDLPACRLAHHKRPFTYTGLDYFGPLLVTVGRTKQKRYVALFTCLTTRAIHLEVAASLSTDSAVMALRRMMARRGCPAEIWSDNGTNLKGADKELRRSIDISVEQEAAKKTISWRYIPPGAPFMGGAWERMVRSVKTALAATLHERCPNEEVLSTLLAEVEYTINSRPLTHVSVSVEDFEALTPNHFLLGGCGMVPRPEVSGKDEANKASWRATQRLADLFWKRWVKECLPELQHRREPHGRGTPVQTGDLVQIVDPNLPRNVWIRGRVVATYPGPDGVVRAVDVRTKGGVLRRPVRKLVILPVSTNDAPAPGDTTRLYGGSDVQDT